MYGQRWDAELCIRACVYIWRAFSWHLPSEKYMVNVCVCVCGCPSYVYVFLALVYTHTHSLAGFIGRWHY